MAKEIFFMVDESCYIGRTLHTWKETKKAIDDGLETIVTTQMGFLHTRLFELGYRVYVYENSRDWYEIKLGCDNKSTNKDIRNSHNLFKLWLSGGFKTKDGGFYDH